MKLVALALALLLAVGSHAMPLQADEPSAQLFSLAETRLVMDKYLTSLESYLTNAINGLEDPQHTEYKATAIERLNTVFGKIRSVQTSVAPMTDGVVKTLSEATAGLRETILTDFKTLRADLEPKYDNLKKVVEKHIADYRVQLNPIIEEYSAKQKKDIEEMKVNLDPTIKILEQKIATNVEETKQALIPMVDTVRTKLAERVEQLKAIAQPYVEDYKEQMKNVYNQARSMNTQEITDLAGKVEFPFKNIRDNIMQIFSAPAEPTEKR